MAAFQPIRSNKRRHSNLEKESKPCGQHCFLHIVRILENYIKILICFVFKDSVKEKIIKDKQKHEEERRSSRKLNNTNDSGNEASSEDSNDSIKSMPKKGESIDL